jgi:hypothetical protein
MLFSVPHSNRLWRPACSSRNYTMNDSVRNRPSTIEAATAEPGASGPAETVGHGADTPQNAPAELNWQSLLTIVLGMAIGITFAKTMPARLLGLTDYWAVFAVEATAAGLAGAIVASLVRGVFKLFGRGK